MGAHALMMAYPPMSLETLMFNSNETAMLGRSGKGQVWDDLGRMTARDTRSMKRSDDRAWKKQVRMMGGQR